MRSQISTIKGRAQAQAGANTETTTGVVTRVYVDTLKNVIAADVRLHGHPQPLIRVANSSGIILWSGAHCVVNWSRGSRFAPSILGLSGAESSAVVSSAAAASTTVINNNGQSTDTPDLSGIGFLLSDADESVPDGVVLQPGANVYFEDIAAEETSGGLQNAQRIVSMRVLVLETLPDAATTNLLDGTLVDLVDGSGEVTGMYRLDRASSVWRLRSSGGGGGSSAIGLPTDGAYSSGALSPSPTDTIADTFDDVVDLLNAMAPAQADDLVGENLTIVSGPTRYSAKLSANNVSAWTVTGFSPGDVVAGYCIASPYSLRTPANTFRMGRYGVSAGYGTVSHRITSSSGTIESASRALSAGTGTTGTLTVNSISLFNNLWAKGQGTISGNLTDGFNGHVIRHTEAGDSNRFDYWYDSFSAGTPNPSFSVNPSHTVLTDNAKWLSGVRYYGQGSQLQVSFTGASGIFNRAYHPTNVGRITIPNITISGGTCNPGSVPDYTDTFAVVDQTVTLTTAGQIDTSKILTVTLYKPAGNTVAQNSALARMIDTFAQSGNSSATSETFHDEEFRLQLGTTTAWDSTVTLADGNAQVRPGILRYPISADYGGASFTGDQIYERRFTKVSASNGSLTFGTLTVAQISPYGSGDVNVLIKLDGDGKWFDAGVLAGTAGRDGSTEVLAYGAQLPTSAGSVLQFSLGLFTTGPTGGTNDGKYRIRIRFRNSNRTITSLVTA